MPEETPDEDQHTQAEDAPEPADDAKPEVRELVDPKADERRAVLKQGVLIFLISCMCAAFLQINPGYMPVSEDPDDVMWSWNRNEGLPRGDGYYHIKSAYLYRTGDMFEAGEDFHWTRESIWNGDFSDKEFLYHIYLIPFTLMADDIFHWQALINGAKFSTIVAAGLFMLAMFVALRWLGVPRAWFWTLVGGAALGVILTIRLTEPRSWVFGVSLAMLGWGALWKRSKPWLFVIGVVYVLAYTGSHLFLAFAVFMAGFRLVFGPNEGGRKAALKSDAVLIGIVFAGMVVGWLLHPQSVELLKIWWVQNIVVPYTHAGGAPTGVIADISSAMLGWPDDASVPRIPPAIMGNELAPPPIGELLSISTFEVVAPFLLPLLSAWFRVRPSKKTLATFIVALGFFVLHWYNGRFVEYAAPFGLFAAALWITEIIQARTVRRRLDRCRFSRKQLFVAAIVVVCLLVTINMYRCSEAIGFRPRCAYLEAGVWLQEHDEVKGKVVYNANWDAFPELFLFRSDCDYIWGMDPVFTAAMADRDAERVIGFQTQNMESWGKGPQDAVRVLREDFDADYLFLRDDSPSQWKFDEMDEWEIQGLIESVEVQRDYGFGLYRLKEALAE